MSPSAPHAVPSAAFLQLQVIAGALAASVFIYAGIAWFITGEAVGAGYSPPGLSPPLPWVLAGLAVALLLAAPVIAGAMRPAAKAPSGADRGGPAVPPSGDLLAAYRTRLLVGFALREAAAVLGLVITLMTGDVLWCWTLSAAALLAMALAWPSRAGVERVARGGVVPR